MVEIGSEILSGIKHWKFGLWIYQEDEIFKCSIFGEHKDYIDKFKPTATEISYSFSIKGDESFIFELENFIVTVRKIKHCPLFMKYYFYIYNSNMSFLMWILKEFWFYRIELPIKNFFSKQVNYFMAKCIQLYLKMFYGNKCEDIKVCKLYGSDIIHPSVEVKIKVKDKYIDTVGYKLFHQICSFRGFDYNMCIDVCMKKENKWRAIYWK